MNLLDSIFLQLYGVTKKTISSLSFKHTCSMATKVPKIRLPGYGIALNEGTDKVIPYGDRFPNALLGEGYT